MLHDKYLNPSYVSSRNRNRKPSLLLMHYGNCDKPNDQRSVRYTGQTNSRTSYAGISRPCSSIARVKSIDGRRGGYFVRVPMWDAAIVFYSTSSCCSWRLRTRLV